MATGAVLLRGQILTFGSWPQSDMGGHTQEVAIPGQAPFLARGGMPGQATGGARYAGDDRAVRELLGGHGGVSALSPAPIVAAGGGGAGVTTGVGGVPSPLRPSGRSSAPGSATGTGPTSRSEGSRPLSGYTPGGGSSGSPTAGGPAGKPSTYTPITGTAAPSAPSSARTTGDDPYIFSPTGEGPRTSSSAAAPQDAQDAPAADSGPVVSSADNAPSQPSDPAPTAPPAETTPPADPTPTPPADPAPADPTPPADPAPADPAPPAADPAPADPAPSGDDTQPPSGDPAAVAAAAAIPSSVA